MCISSYDLPMISVLRQKFFPVLRSKHFPIIISVKLYFSRLKIKKNNNVINFDAQECFYIANKTIFM